MKNRSGFTLVEILVAVALLSILSSVVLFSTLGAGQSSRDIDRQADLRIVQSALELYKLKYNRYPEGCNGPGVWSGQIGSSYQCSATNNEYIVGLAPEFIPTLPQDPTVTSGNRGYVYTTNTDGTVYKFMAKSTVESEIVQRGHEFQSCDVNTSGGSAAGICNTSAGGSLNNLNGWCDQNNNGPQGIQFDTSYAVWGGIAPPAAGNSAEVNTEAIICDIQ